MKNNHYFCLNGTDVRHEIKLKNQHNTVFYEKLTFIYLEMPKFNVMEADLKTPFEKWLFILKNLPKLEGRPTKFQAEAYNKLFVTAEIEKFSSEERMYYEQSLKNYRD